MFAIDSTVAPTAPPPNSYCFVAIIPPIAAFVAAGFEHSVANMYFISIGLFVKADDTFVAATPGLPALDGLTWKAFFVDNLVPVTIGNVVGGALMVGAIYWFVYLRGARAPAAEAPASRGAIAD